MKNSIKRAQSQAGSSFAERENFRPKVKQLKKTILTLVALLAVTTGAWAEETPLLTIESKGNTSFTSESKTFGGMVTVTFSNTVSNYGDNMGWYSTGEASLTVAGINGYTITSCKFYTEDGPASSGFTVEGESPSVYLYEAKVYLDDSKSVKIGSAGVTKIEVYGAAAATATTVDLTWDATAKTATLTNGMPAGNVTVSVEYYPQATMDDGAVTAADADARATTDDPLVKVDATKLTGAKKLMYFVSNSGTTAPAYDAEGWTDQLPNAEGFTQQGIVYVWYYPVGTDEGVDGATATYSDGDICLQSITARIAAAPLWNAEFDLTDAPEADKTGKWSTNIPEGGVKKGTEVTVTYSGSKKIIGVKAEKKAAPKLLNFSPLGQIFYYYEGETWGQAIQNHPENAANGWSIEEFGTTVMYGGRALCDSAHDDDITKDTVVNPNGGYLWGPES